MNLLLYRLITKQVKISKHIQKYEFNMGIMIISIWVVKANGKFYLIDSGLSNMATYVMTKFLANKEIEAVFLTHGHSDHIGGVNALKRINPEINVHIDSKELPYISGKEAYPGRKNLEKKIFNAHEFICLNSEESRNIQKKAGIEAIFTPGHSPGHSCFYHKEDKVLIAGDLFTTNSKGKLKPPMKQFTANMEEALDSGYRVLNEHKNALLSVCHGTEVREPFDKLNHLIKK